jgi:hypothetical protein
MILLYSCGQNDTAQKHDKQIKNKSLSGVYEYIYPSSTPDLIENHYIILDAASEQLNGYYYGTSDEFDDIREGYPPAFFVAKMHNLKIEKDTLSFTLIVTNDDFLTMPVDLKYRSTENALKAGYKKWDNLIPTAPKNYKGIFKNPSIIVFNEEDDFLIKTFKKR